jgi:hypothetical protein
MKRVALLFCGRVLTHQQCRPTFQKHIVTPLRNAGYEYDSFLSHSSETIDNDTQDFINNNNVVSYEMVIPNNSHLDHVPLSRTKVSKRVSFVMYYHWMNTYRLMKEYSERHSITYDFVIYMRADQYFSSDLILPAKLNNNTVYIPAGNDHTGLNDQFAFGTMDSMKIFTDLYNNVETLYNKTGIGFHTETYVLLYMIYMNMNVIRFPLHYVLHPK